MKLFNFKSVRTRILFSCMNVIFLVLLFSIFNLFNTHKAKKEMERILGDQLDLLILDEQLAMNMAERTNLLRAYLLHGKEQYKEIFQDTTEESMALESEVLALNDSEEVVDLIDKKMLWGNYTNEFFAEYDKGNVERAYEIMEQDIQPLSNELLQGFQALAANREDRMKEIGEEAIESGKSNFALSVTLNIAVIFVGITIAILSASKIANPLRKVTNRMKMIAEGDLSGEGK